MAKNKEEEFDFELDADDKIDEMRLKLI